MGTTASVDQSFVDDYVASLTRGAPVNVNVEKVTENPDKAARTIGILMGETELLEARLQYQIHRTRTLERELERLAHASPDIAELEAFELYERIPVKEVNDVTLWRASSRRTCDSPILYPKVRPNWFWLKERDAHWFAQEYLMRHLGRRTAVITEAQIRKPLRFIHLTEDFGWTELRIALGIKRKDEDASALEEHEHIATMVAEFESEQFDGIVDNVVERRVYRDGKVEVIVFMNDRTVEALDNAAYVTGLKYEDKEMSKIPVETVPCYSE